MKQVIVIFSILMMLSGCRPYTAKDLMAADRNFSEHSEDNGMKAAFLEFADENAVMLQKHSMPIIGRNAISESFETFSDEGIILTWEPMAAEISKSGDLGYTYGLYTLFIKADSSTTKGKYVSVWKLQKDGSWKFVLDAGNEGI